MVSTADVILSRELASVAVDMLSRLISSEAIDGTLDKERLKTSMIVNL